MLGEKFADVEEKYDLTKGTEGFGEEGDEVEGDGLGLADDEVPEDGGGGGEEV